MNSVVDKMDPPLIHESSFSAANPASYSLAEIWPISGEPGGSGGGLGLRMGNLGQSFGGLGDSSVNRDGSLEESTVTEQSGGGCGGGGGGRGRKRRDVSSEDESSKQVSTSSGNGLKYSGGKRMKLAGSSNENGSLKAEVEESSAAGDKKPAEESTKPSEPPKQDFIHVRARRGQATDSHSLAERARREKISERMKILQDLVPGCNKVIGKALVLDEIINYIQSLQHQVEFLSMKLEAVNSRMNMNPAIEAFPPKDNVNLRLGIFWVQHFNLGDASRNVNVCQQRSVFVVSLAAGHHSVALDFPRFAVVHFLWHC